MSFAQPLLLAGCVSAGLRITRVERLEVPGERPAVVAPNAYKGTRPRGIVERVVLLHTDRGLVGTGTATRKNAEEVAASLVGLDPAELFEWKDGRIAGIRPAAYELRGMDVAVLDLLGQARGVPVAELFGPLRRTSVEGYDSSLYFEDLLEGAELEGYPYAAEPPEERVARKAKEAVERRGFRVLKLKVGRSGRLKGEPVGVLKDILAVNAVRKAVGPEVRIFVDGNDGYKGRPERVLEFARGTRASGIFALEEMLPETG